jgi:enoyl-CoA hydratase/carnithine racemase
VAEINERADEFSAVVFTGQGRAFCAGGDMQFLEERANDTPTRNRYELVAEVL